MTDERPDDADRRPEDLDTALRPKTLDEFVVQKAARENLRSSSMRQEPRRSARPCPFLRAARSRQDDSGADHRPRTRVGFRATSGHVIAKSGDLAATSPSEDGDVLFIARFTG